MEAGPRKGAYLLSAMRVRAGWGVVSERRWPIDVKQWPPKQPVSDDELDRIASYSRVPGYFAVRDVNEAKYVLASGNEFQLTVPVTAQWHRAGNGVIDVPRLVRPGTFGENHAISICGYDDNTGMFTFRNSWGARWGDAGYGYLPYVYMTFYMTEAWACVPSLDIRPKLPPNAYEVSLGEFLSPAGYPLLQLAIYGNDGEKVGWCFTTIRGDEYLEVEDFFIKPGYSPVDVVQLGKGLVGLYQRLGLKPKFWVPHCDAAPDSYNFTVLSNVIGGLGLLQRRALGRWAHAVAS